MAFFDVKKQLSKIVDRVKEQQVVGHNTVNLASFYKNFVQKHPMFYGHQFFIEFYGAAVRDIYGDEWAFDQSSQLNPKFWIKSSSVPKVNIAPAKVDFLANGFEIPGVVQYPDTWNVTFILDQYLSQYRFLELQMKYLSSLQNSGGGSKIIPDLNARVYLLDSTMTRVVHAFVIQGIWLSSLPNIGFKYTQGSSTIAEVNASFTMQYFYTIGNDDFNYNGNPLGNQV